MGGGGATAGTNQSDDLATAHFLPDTNQNLGQMRVISLNAVAMIDNDQTAVSAGHHFGLHDHAVGSRAHAGAGGGGDINALMEGPFSREWVGAAGEAIYQPA